MLGKAITNICKSWWYSLLLLIYAKITYYSITSINIKLLNDFSIKGTLKQANTLFIFALLFAILIYTARKLIISLYLTFYYGLYNENNMDKIEIKIDQNNIIRDSYMELSNGNKIPINISKIVTRIPEDSATGENNE